MALAAQHEKLLGAAALLVLGIGCFLVISPFLTAIMWAAVLCWSTWPMTMPDQITFTLGCLVCSADRSRSSPLMPRCRESRRRFGKGDLGLLARSDVGRCHGG